MVADLTIGAHGGGAFDVEAYDWKADDWLSLDQIRMNGRLQTVRIPSEGLTPDGRGFVRFRRDGPPFLDVYYTGIQGAAA